MTYKCPFCKKHAFKKFDKCPFCGRNSDDYAAEEYECKSNNAEGNNEEIPSSELTLESLIGITELKTEIQSLLNFVKIQHLREEKGLKIAPISLHMVFVGNPGTGKTTVARIIAKELKNIGVLTKGHVVEVDRSKLVAGYVGHTAIQTAEYIEKAKGGVLFIDEAYTLAKEGNDFGKEAIDTLLKGMEDNRKDLIVIVAGYRKEMNDFISSNPGLKSRFTRYFEFRDYNADEMLQMFEKMCSSNDYVLTQGAKKKCKDKFVEWESNKDPFFGNGRDVRNFFEQVITKQANRLTNFNTDSVDDFSLIIDDDILE